MHHFRLRFSLRTLAVFIAIVCGYFGFWGATMSDAQKPYFKYRGIAHSPAPFVVVVECWMDCPASPHLTSYYVGARDFWLELPIEKVKMELLSDVDRN